MARKVWEGLRSESAGTVRAVLPPKEYEAGASFKSSSQSRSTTVSAEAGSIVSLLLQLRKIV